MKIGTGSVVIDGVIDAAVVAAAGVSTTALAFLLRVTDRVARGSLEMAARNLFFVFWDDMVVRIGAGGGRTGAGGEEMERVIVGSAGAAAGVYGVGVHSYDGADSNLE